jgi:uncharacterized protein (TIGR02246 family)
MDDTRGDEEAIYALLQSVVAGWNRGDGEAMAAAFDADADYIVFNGMRLKGRQQIAAARIRQILRRRKRIRPQTRWKLHSVT